MICPPFAFHSNDQLVARRLSDGNGDIDEEGEEYVGSVGGKRDSGGRGNDGSSSSRKERANANQAKEKSWKSRVDNDIYDIYTASDGNSENDESVSFRDAWRGIKSFMGRRRKKSKGYIFNSHSKLVELI